MSLIAIWIVSKIGPMAAGNSNAFVMARTDLGVLDAVQSLTRKHAVLLTTGSTHEGLSVGCGALTMTDIRDFSKETIAVREQVVALACRLSRKTPVFKRRSTSVDVHVADGTVSDRALETANLLGRVWADWLETDRHRRRFTTDARAVAVGALTQNLRSSQIMAFPPVFSARLTAETLV